MRWAWVDQGGDRPIGGPRRPSALMYVRRSRGRTTRRAGRHPLVDDGEVEHPGGWVRLRETARQECGQLGLKLGWRQVQAPRGLLDWHVARVNREADAV